MLFSQLTKEHFLSDSVSTKSFLSFLYNSNDDAVDNDRNVANYDEADDDGE